jgi:hypothetical protein
VAIVPSSLNFRPLTELQDFGSRSLFSEAGTPGNITEKAAAECKQWAAKLGLRLDPNVKLRDSIELVYMGLLEGALLRPEQHGDVEVFVRNMLAIGKPAKQNFGLPTNLAALRVASEQGLSPVSERHPRSLTLTGLDVELLAQKLGLEPRDLVGLNEVQNWLRVLDLSSVERQALSAIRNLVADQPWSWEDLRTAFVERLGTEAVRSLANSIPDVREFLASVSSMPPLITEKDVEAGLARGGLDEKRRHALLALRQLFESVDSGWLDINDLAFVCKYGSGRQA